MIGWVFIVYEDANRIYLVSMVVSLLAGLVAIFFPLSVLCKLVSTSFHSNVIPVAFPVVIPVVFSMYFQAKSAKHLS